MIVGIDLGTTNSACAIMRDGLIEMIPNSLGEVLTPSAVSVDPAGQIITGKAARERQSTHADATITAFKRLMGSDRVVRLAGKSFRAEELSALVLAGLKRDAEAYLGEPVVEAVITVPAYFNDKQRKATRLAGQLAGLTVERLVNEPTAAALAYGIHNRDAESRFLVLDLGGGTFDVSVLEIFEGIIEVRSSAGDNRLGGEDFNAALIQLALKALPELSGALARHGTGALPQKLREAAERTRRGLTEADHAGFTCVWNDETHTTMIDAPAWEEACAPLLDRMRQPVARALRDCGIAAGTLDEIILVGGATRMPIVRRTFTRMFGRFPNASVDADEAVARGAAVQAALKARDAALNDVVVTDVCPYSLGVEVSEPTGQGRQVTGIFAPILERNCVVPASREYPFFTVSDNQPAVDFKVYQGESRWVKDNIKLGELSVPVPRGKAGSFEILVRFSYDINGLLEVDVAIPKTGLTRQLVIADEDGIDPRELEKRHAALAALKVHPRDSDAVRAALSRAGRCVENAVGDERAWLNHNLAQFEIVVEAQDPRQIVEATANLHKALDEFEGQSFL
jgi:molecular chaperone HscC